MSAPASPTRSRAWFTRTLNATSDKLDGLEGLGVTVSGPISWVDEDGIAIRATPHGDAVTIELVDSTEPLKRWDVYIGWLKA